MANEIAQFQQGADILQQVDVSEIFTSMAMGIADAQQKLDNNSIAQIKKLSEQEVAGKSLLELGFVPAFYSFTYADVSCNISLQMSLKTNLNVGFSASLTLTSNKGYTSDQSNFATENKYSKTSEEYKSSRHFTFKASEKTAIKIEKESYQLKQEEGCIKMIEKFEEEVMQNEKIADIESEVQRALAINNTSAAVNVQVVNGYICISEAHKETSAIGILKINAYDGKKIDVDSAVVDATNSFTVATNFATAFASANATKGSGKVYGFSKDGKFWDNGATTGNDMSLYFKHDSKKNKYGAKLGSTVYYAEEVGDVNVANTPTRNKQNSASLQNAYLLLAEILKHDGNDTVIVNGETDKSGSKEYNENLGIRRALAFINELAARGIATSKFKPVSLGETATAQGSTEQDVNYRKASIQLNADYIFFVGGTFDMDACLESGSGNSLYKEATLNSGSPALNIVYGSSTVNMSAASSLTTIEEYIKENHKEYILEKRHNVLYLLHKDSVVKFYVFSKDSEKIDIASEKSYDGSGTETENTHYISDTVNRQSSVADSASTADKNNTFALAASVDARYSRQFDMSVQGNASMSARLVAVPPPKAFELIILNGITRPGL
jgi:outer membrane protein OmpA-like peptidoglycan-associated protein